MFCLGDRAYGPQFCAAGRKLAVRLLQLGMNRQCEVGYGDDNTPNGGVFADLDYWLEESMLPVLCKKPPSENPLDKTEENPVALKNSPYHVKVGEKLATTKVQEWKRQGFDQAYRSFFTQSCPITAYSYTYTTRRRLVDGRETIERKTSPLLGEVISNERITSTDWEQDTRHIRIHVRGDQDSSSTTLDEDASLPYQAGDIATILPFNSDAEVDRFLQVLPVELQQLADSTMQINVNETLMNNSFCRWPSDCTFHGWLKYCADIHSLPEREDLRALSPFCSDQHEWGLDQRKKLISLSETSEAALYADYILREKRSWADVLFDFDSLGATGSRLTLEALLVLLPLIRPRHFSIASAPSTELATKGTDSTHSAVGFTFELCVALVQGRTPLRRSYHGLCSEYLSRLVPTSDLQPLVQLWIRPGSFSGLPLELSNGSSQFDVPMLCVGAGTGIAPLRSLILEREAVRCLALKKNPITESDNILVFGCRKQKADYYYEAEWQPMCQDKCLRVLNAFSRDNLHKLYVQRVLKEADGGTLIAMHILEKSGAVYIAGGPKMARAVKEEIIEALGKELEGGEKQANLLVNKLQRMGRFSVEAWS
jgi:sulfite reductase alpha subunit-like flavoprotein